MRKLRTFDFWLFVSMAVFLYIIVMVSHTIEHESAHVAIYNAYGVDSSVHYQFLSADGIFHGRVAYTEAQDGSGCTESCHQLHEMNEIVGYNNTVLVNSLFMCLFLYFFYNELRSDA